MDPELIGHLGDIEHLRRHLDEHVDGRGELFYGEPIFCEAQPAKTNWTRNSAC